MIRPAGGGKNTNTGLAQSAEHAVGIAADYESDCRVILDGLERHIVGLVGKFYVCNLIFGCGFTGVEDIGRTGVGGSKYYLTVFFFGHIPVYAGCGRLGEVACRLVFTGFGVISCVVCGSCGTADNRGRHCIFIEYGRVFIAAHIFIDYCAAVELHAFNGTIAALACVERPAVTRRYANGEISAVRAVLFLAVFVKNGIAVFIDYLVVEVFGRNVESRFGTASVKRDGYRAYAVAGLLFVHAAFKRNEFDSFLSFGSACGYDDVSGNVFNSVVTGNRVCLEVGKQIYLFAGFDYFVFELGKFVRFDVVVAVISGSAEHDVYVDAAGTVVCGSDLRKRRVCVCDVFVFDFYGVDVLGNFVFKFLFVRERLCLIVGELDVGVVSIEACECVLNVNSFFGINEFAVYKIVHVTCVCKYGKIELVGFSAVLGAYGFVCEHGGRSNVCRIVGVASYRQRGELVFNKRIVVKFDCERAIVYVIRIHQKSCSSRSLFACYGNAGGEHKSVAAEIAEEYSLCISFSEVVFSENGFVFFAGIFNLPAVGFCKAVLMASDSCFIVVGVHISVFVEVESLSGRTVSRNERGGKHRTSGVGLCVPVVGRKQTYRFRTGIQSELLPGEVTFNIETFRAVVCVKLSFVARTNIYGIYCRRKSVCVDLICSRKQGEIQFDVRVGEKVISSVVEDAFIVGLRGDIKTAVGHVSGNFKLKVRVFDLIVGVPFFIRIGPDIFV